MGGKNELSAALKEVKTDSVKNFLLSQDCALIEFRMNVQSTIPIWAAYRSDLFVPYVQFSPAFCKTNPRN